MTQNPDLNASSAPKKSAQNPSQDPYAAVVLAENSSLQAPDLACFKQLAAEIQLPAESLKRWVAYAETRAQQKAQQAQQEAQARQDAWARQTQELFGPAWQEEVSKAVRAADAFGGASLRQLLEETGLGNHPVMVRTFHTVAQYISEDVTPGGAPLATADKTFTQALYGKN